MNQPVNRSVLYALMAVFVAVLGMGASSVWYSNHVAEQNNRRWCALLANLDDAYRQNPPTSPIGRKIAEDMHNLRVGFGC